MPSEWMSSPHLPSEFCLSITILSVLGFRKDYLFSRPS